MTLRIKTDIHTHTLASRHAYSTILENLAAARDAGLELLGSADHFSSQVDDRPTLHKLQFFVSQEVWPRVWQGVTLLRAAEVDIVSLDGAFFAEDIPCTANLLGQPFPTRRSLFAQATRKLDYLVASVHDRSFTRGASLAETTNMYVKALENPRVFVIGHPGRAGVPFELDALLGRAKELGKAIEINDHSLEKRDDGYATCQRIAERCADLGVYVAVSSDAHIATSVGRLEHATTMLEEIHFPEELVVNRDRNTLLDALAAANVCDLREFKA